MKFEHSLKRRIVPESQDVSIHAYRGGPIVLYKFVLHEDEGLGKNVE